MPYPIIKCIFYTLYYTILHYYYNILIIIHYILYILHILYLFWEELPKTSLPTLAPRPYDRMWMIKRYYYIPTGIK